MLAERTPAKNDADKGLICSGCGAPDISGAGFCPVCGKLVGEGFHPLDAIRSSHNLQGRTLPSTPVKTETLFRRDRSSISDTAWACTVYSMVPYLGILFVPVALVIGGFGYVAARRTPDERGGRSALTSIGVSAVLLVIQIIFWWLLYLIPEIGI